MAASALADLPSWLENPLGGETTVQDTQLLEARLADVSTLLFPDEVCEAVGVSALVGALKNGLLGPPEAARSILCNDQLFAGTGADHEVHSNVEFRTPLGGTSRPAPVTTLIEEQQERSRADNAAPAHSNTRNMLSRWLHRLEKALFDSPNITYVSFLLAAVSRVVFNWIPEIPSGIEFWTFLGLLLAVCANRCAVKRTLPSSIVLSSVNAVLHVCLLMTSGILAPSSFTLSSSLLTHTAALGIMLTSYTEKYLFRFLSQSISLSLVLLDGYLPSEHHSHHHDEEGNNALTATCPAQGVLSSRTALTLVFCLILSSFMSETVKYKSHKSYSGK